MKRLTIMIGACIVLIAFGLGEAVAKDVVVTSDYDAKGTWRPLDEDFLVFFPSLAFLDELEALAIDNPAAAETSPWQTAELSEMCPRPLVFAVEEMLVPQREIMKHGCLIFADGNVFRETRSTTPSDIEILKFANRRFKVQANITIITTKGKFVDNLSRPKIAPMQAEAQSNASYCVTEDKRTTCSLPDIPEPLCRVVRYGRDKMVVEGLKRDIPITSCHHYVEGSALHDDDTVQGDVCFTKTTGDGKVVSDCPTFNFIDHQYNGDVFSQFGDSVIVTTQQNKIFVDPPNVNLLFIKRVEGLPSTKVIGSGDNTRIITVGADQEM